jgi:hypothetical protein
MNPAYICTSSSKGAGEAGLPAGPLLPLATHGDASFSDAWVRPE